MRIEQDRIEFLAGVRKGHTLGNPISLLIHNRDSENWKEIMAPEPGPPATEKVVTCPRPGHADLVGAINTTTAISAMCWKRRALGRRPFEWPWAPSRNDCWRNSA